MLIGQLLDTYKQYPPKLHAKQPDTSIAPSM